MRSRVGTRKAIVPGWTKEIGSKTPLHRVASVLTVALLAIAGLLVGSTTSFATTDTSVSLTLLNSVGTPVANYPVNIFYIPFDPLGTGEFQLALMGGGTTDTNGVIAAILDTTAVQTAELAYSDTGAGSFTILVAGPQTANGWVRVYDVISYQALTTDTLTAQGTPDLGNGPGAAEAPTYLVYEHIASGNAWTALGYWNIAAGIESTVTLGLTRSTTSEVATTACYQGTWCAGGWVSESNERSQADSFSTPTKSYHYKTFGFYTWWKYSVKDCTRGCTSPWYEWHPHNYIGPACDPDGGNPGGSPCGTSQYAYTPPTFNSQFSRTLNSTGDQYTRSSVKGSGAGWSFTLAVVTLKASAMFATSTTVQWKYHSTGCGQTRWIWGNGQSYTTAPVVQASCTS